MSRAVFDASVAVKWFINDIKSEQARSFRLTYQQLAPALILIEVSNALLGYVRRNEFQSDLVARAVDNVRKTVELQPDHDLLGSAIDLSIKVGHSIYDMLYVALALRSQLPLVTADLKLVGKLRASQLPVTIIALENP